MGKADGKVVIQADLDDKGYSSKISNLGKITKNSFNVARTAIVGATAAVGAGVAAIGKLTTSFSSSADAIDKGSQRLGMTNEQYQEWAYILGQCGGSIDTLEVGMKTLNDVLVGVKDGVSGNISTLEDFQNATGVNIDLNGTQYDQYMQVVDALAGMEDKQKMATLAVDMFGKAGLSMIPMLNQGTDGIEKLRERAHDLGIVMSDEAVKSGVEFGDMMSDLKQSTKALMNDAISAILPDLTNLASSFIDLTHNVDGSSEAFSQNLSTAITGITKIITDSLPDITKMGITILTALADGLLNAMPELAAAIPDIILTLTEGLMTIIPKLPEIAWDIISALVKGFWDKRSEFLEAGKNIVLGLAEGIKNAVTTAVDAIKGVGSKILDGVKGFFGIHSPSREMMTIGEYISLGLAEGIITESGSVITAAEAMAMGIKNIFVDIEEDGTVLGAAVSNAVLDGYREAGGEEKMKEKAKTIEEIWAETANNIKDSMLDGIKEIMAGFGDVSEAIVNGKSGWEAFGKAGMEALAGILEGIGAQLAGMAIASYPNFAHMALAAAGSVAAYTAAGGMRAAASRFENGGIVGRVPGIPDSGDRQLVRVNAGELILNRAQQRNLASSMLGSGTVIRVEFSGTVLGDQQSIGKWVNEGIQMAQRRGAI